RCCRRTPPTTGIASCSAPTPRALRPKRSGASWADPSGSTSRISDRSRPAALAARQPDPLASRGAGAHRPAARNGRPALGGRGRVGRGAGGLARLSAVPDGLLALSPDGYEPESSIGQGIAAAMERGIPLLGVVRERWTPSAAAAPAAEPPPRAPRAVHPSPAQGGEAPKRRARPAVVAITLAAGAAGGWVLLATAGESFRARLGDLTHVAPASPRPHPVTAAPVRHAPPPPPPPLPP